MATNLNLEEVAALTTGFTGADLANLVNESALSATRSQREFVTLEDFNIAIERIIAGLAKKSRILNQKERKIVAYHEMGHAIVASALPGTDKVHKVSIIPRGIGALGYTIHRPTEDRYLMTSEELKNKMAMLLGGRAAEMLFLNDISTGSADDIVKATDIAKNIAMRYGMVKDMGHVAYEDASGKYLGQDTLLGRSREFGEKVADHLDQVVKELVDNAYDQAFRIVEVNRNVIEKSANELLLKETLSEQDLKQFISQLQ
jgi:cell division protease FtsH